ncbi:MAG: PA domain-containing protein [Mycobacteriales bacterium]
MIASTTPKAAVGLALALAVGLLPALASSASAGPDEQHGGTAGHLPATAHNVRLVGTARVADRSPTTAPPEGSTPLESRVADVAVSGNYGYLAAFREPDCTDGGVFVVDLTDPAAPVEVPEAFIATTAGSYVGEGLQVLRIGARDVLLFNNEVCDDQTGKGGMTLVDVTNPRSPVVLAAHAGDTTGDGTDDAAVTPVHTIHSVYGWVDAGRAFAVLVDNEEDRDVDIMEITDPTAPVMLSETSFVDDARVVQADPPNGNSRFLHDAVVTEIDGRQTMLASYWDNGFLLLDVEDPTAPQLLRDTDYAATEPFAARLGLAQDLEPEGNAHQAEFSPDGSLFLGTDEDFNPFRVIATITSGPGAGTEATATNGSDTPAVTDSRTLSGTTDFVGRGCTDTDPATEGDQSDPYPTKAGDIAVIERGACSFQDKYDRAVAAGYTGVIVFNSTAGCDALLTPAVSGPTVPFVFVTRSTGLQILNQTPAADPCAQEAPPLGGDTADVAIRGVFDGWGYVHLYDTDTMADLGQYAIDEALDPAFATGFGDLSVHEVAVDPKVPGRAYLAYYSGGLRVIEYDRDGIREIGAYIGPDGSNLWGVEYWTSPTTGQDYVLASERDGALQVFQYAPEAGPAPSASATPTPTSTPHGDPAPSPLPCATTTTTLQTSTIVATGSAEVTVRTAAGSAVELWAYTRPSSTFQRVRTGTADADGLARFTVRPPANTRLYGVQPGCDIDVAGQSVVLNVRTALSLFVQRNGTRDYTFTGDSLPARRGGLIVSLYRVTTDGRQVLTAQTRADAANGQWRIDRRFTGTGRFGFVVRTGQDLQNAPGSSNVRSLLVY